MTIDVSLYTTSHYVPTDSRVNRDALEANYTCKKTVLGVQTQFCSTFCAADIHASWAPNYSGEVRLTLSSFNPLFFAGISANSRSIIDDHVVKGSVYYFRDNSTPKTLWSKTAAITTTATGDVTIIQNSYGTPQVVGNFEVVVSEGRDLVHYWRDNGSTELPWIKTIIVNDNAAD